MNRSQQLIRVRFAPSPTGHLHIGGLRSAYFNWLFARHNNGKFLLRIEDTDLERSKKEYLEGILQAFAWCDIASDEPIVIQTERKARHVEVANKLLQEGKLYKCFCTQEDLENRLGGNAGTEEGYTRYDERCRDRQPQLDDASKPYALRVKIDRSRGPITWNDLIRGEISFESTQLDDFIIVRSDGSPMYNFVVVVDDADMNISHVIRGEDHISNTPKQILLYEACGFPLPEFGHVPLILGADGQRLSKRHAATSVMEYKNAGFLADALCNYLVRLGWAYGDQEIFTREELVSLFSLSGVNKKGSIFDIKKLEWVNSIYMRQASAEKLVALIVRDIDSQFKDRLPAWSESQLEGAINLYKERTVTLRDLMIAVDNLYVRPHFETYDVDPVSQGAFKAFVRAIAHLEVLDRLRIEQLAKEVCVSAGIKLGGLLPLVRVALTGLKESPSVYDLICVLGKEESRIRLMAFSECFKK